MKNVLQYCSNFSWKYTSTLTFHSQILIWPAMQLWQTRDKVAIGRHFLIPTSVQRQEGMKRRWKVSLKHLKSAHLLIQESPHRLILNMALPILSSDHGLTNTALTVVVAAVVMVAVAAVGFLIQPYLWWAAVNLYSIQENWHADRCGITINMAWSFNAQDVDHWDVDQ